MGSETKIQWADYTFQPWIGCQRVSPGCENCYAEAYDKRVGGVPKSQRHDPSKPQLRWGPTAPRTRTSAEYWRQPLKWDREAEKAGVRRRVFCASLADVFEDRPELRLWRFDLFELIRATPHLDWLLLTKRPQNFAELWPNGEPSEFPFPARSEARAVRAPLPPPSVKCWPNVWLGTTVEDQQRANERISHLLAVPAAVHFLSMEPLLQAVDLSPWLMGDGERQRRKDAAYWAFTRQTRAKPPSLADPAAYAPSIGWVIVGGESGGGARPFEAEWARSLLKQCRSAGVAAFVKQMGSYTVDRNDAGFNGDDDGGWHSACEFGGQIRVEELDHGYQGAPVRVYLRDRHGGDVSEWPEDLRVREFPEVSHAA